MKNIKVGDVLILEGTSNKGKNRIRELGKNWTVHQVTDSVLFTSEKCQWLLIYPNDKSKPRWIKNNEDPDFSIVSIQPA